MQPLRLGLIGCGGIARSAHLPAIASLPGLVRLVATADVDLQAAQAAAAPFGADAYADYRSLLARPDIAIVLVATPEFWHREQVEAAAAAGKHVLCEKPMAASLADAEAMIAACRRAGVHLMIGHSRRFTGRYRRVREAIDAGELGEVRLVRENERRSRPPQGAAGYWSPGHWTADPRYSLGAALTNGIHECDLLRWFAGAEPVRVYAEAQVTRPGGAVADFISFTVTFANGAIGSAEVSNCLPAGYPSFHQLEVYGTRGAVRAKDHELQGLVRFRDGAADYPGAYAQLLHIQDAYARELGEFALAVRHDRPVPLPPEEAREALRLALAAVDAARTGRAVDLTGAAGGRSA
jgi:predicted dehydrogenase